MTDTIYAPATPMGGAIAIVRISGPMALEALRQMTGREAFAPRQLQHVEVRSLGRVVDDAMAVYFAGPHSYTGEDMAELHVHGSYAIVRVVMAQCGALGLRMASPGEFTQRAFLAGKMDLAQAEGVMLAIGAQSEAAANAAQRQMRGALGAALAGIQTRILETIAHIEATIDYPDEMEDDPLLLQPRLQESISALRELQKTQKRGRMLHEGYTVAIVGQPNAGKSSLLNALVCDERAIVTEHAGTTRDVLEARLLIRGITVRLYDTAGIRETENEIERYGVEKARALLRDADLRLLMLDGNAPLDDAGRSLLRETAGNARKIVVSKSDLPLCIDIASLQRELGEPVWVVSAKAGEGLDALLDEIAVELPQAQPEREAMLCSARQADAVARALQSLEDAARSFDAPIDLIAIDLRDAWAALGEVTGETASEQVIEQIFSAFCVGK